MKQYVKTRDQFVNENFNERTDSEFRPNPKPITLITKESIAQRIAEILLDRGISERAIASQHHVISEMALRKFSEYRDDVDSIEAWSEFQSLLSELQGVNEDLIDAAGAKAISNWFKTEDEPKFDVAVTDGESIITFRTRSRTEAAQLEQICMANGFKYDKKRV